jgi:hypothetical protein
MTADIDDRAAALIIVGGDPVEADATDLVVTRVPDPCAPVPVPVPLDPNVLRARRDRNDLDLLGRGRDIDYHFLRRCFDDDLLAHCGPLNHHLTAHDWLWMPNFDLFSAASRKR